jgi:hypothetical protein
MGPVIANGSIATRMATGNRRIMLLEGFRFQAGECSKLVARALKP